MSQNGRDPRLVGSTRVAENNVQQDGRAGSADGATAPVPAASAAQLVAFATVLLAGPEAVFDRLIVRICPIATCAYSHLHLVPVGAWRQALVRAPRCRPWLRYRIEVVDVLPAVPALAGQRRRGAA